MAKVKEVSVYLGMSVDNNGVWVKPGVSIKLDIEESDKDNLPAIFDRAFEIAEEEMEKELDRLELK